MFLMRFTERAYVNYTAEDVQNSPNRLFLPNPRKCKISQEWGHLTPRNASVAQGGCVRVKYTSLGRQVRVENMST